MNKKLRKETPDMMFCLKYGEYEFIKICKKNKKNIIIDSNDDISDLIDYQNENFMNKLSAETYIVSEFVCGIIHKNAKDKLNIFDKILQKLKYKINIRSFKQDLEQLIFYGNVENLQYLVKAEKYVEYDNRYDNRYDYHYYNESDSNLGHSDAMINLIHMIDETSECLLKYLNYDITAQNAMHHSNNDLLKICKYRKIIFNGFISKIENSKITEEINGLKKISSLIKTRDDNNKFLFDILINEKLDDKFIYKYNDIHDQIDDLIYILSTRKYIFAEELISSFITIDTIVYHHVDKYDSMSEKIEKLDVIKYIRPFSKKLEIIYGLLSLHGDDDGFFNDEAYEKLLYMLDYYTGMSIVTKKYFGIYKEKLPGIKINSALHDVRFYHP